jgi:ubiquinone/menaquinone biosynthesis C-methylase UbiE
MAHNPLVDFKQIDRTNDPTFFIRFLDTASAEATFQAYKRRINELLEILPGQRILDVGCGTGDDAAAMARQVGSGQVVGVDASQLMVAEAQKRAASWQLPIEFQIADAMQLPFGDNSFDGCRCDRSFMHIPDPKQALAEMLRVAKPGGRIVVYEVDFGTLTIDAPDRPLARKVLNVWCDGFRNGWLGRYVPAIFQDLKLADIVVEPAVVRLNAALVNSVVGPATVNRAVETGVVSVEESKRWLDYLNEVMLTGRFFSSMTGFLVAGRKA